MHGIVTRWAAMPTPIFAVFGDIVKRSVVLQARIQL
jgi:hypothetical protein